MKKKKSKLINREKEVKRRKRKLPRRQPVDSFISANDQFDDPFHDPMEEPNIVDNPFQIEEI